MSGRYIGNSPWIYGKETLVKLSEMGLAVGATAAVNTAAVLKATDYLNQKGGGTIVFDKPGIHNFNTTQAILTGAKTKVIFTPGFEGRCPSIDYASNRAMFEFYGTTSDSALLTVAGVKGAYTITVDDPSKLIIGKMVRIFSNNEVWNGITGVSGYQPVMKMEINFVANIVGSTVYLVNPLESNYSVTGSTVTVQPINAASDLTIIGAGALLRGEGSMAVLDNGDGAVGIRARYVNGFNMEGLKFIGWQNKASEADRCYKARIRKCDVYGLETSKPALNFYAHVSGGSLDVDMADFTVENARRAADSVPTYITRDFKQSGIIARHMNGSGFGSHHCERIEMHDNKVFDAPYIATLRGVHQNIHDNKGYDVDDGFSIGSGSGTTINSATAGTVISNDNEINVRGGKGFYGQVDIERFVSMGDTITGVGDYAYHFRGGKRQNIEIEGHKISIASGGKPAFYFENLAVSGSGSLTVQDGIKIGEGEVYGCTAAQIALIESTDNTQAATDRIFVAGQITDILPASTEQVTLGIRSGGTKNYGQNITIATDRATGALTGLPNVIPDGDFKSGVTNRWRRRLDTTTAAVTQTLSSSSLPVDSVESGKFSLGMLLNLNTPAAPSAGHKNVQEYVVDGRNIFNWGWGAAGAETVCIGLTMRMTKAGTYSLYVKNPANDRTYLTTVTINTTFTNEYQEIQIPGDITGTWPNNADPGLIIGLDLGSGTDFEGVAGWQSGDKTRIAGTMTYINGSTNDQYRILGVSMGLGTKAPRYPALPVQIQDVLKNIPVNRRIYRLWDDFDGDLLDAGWDVKLGSDGSCAVAVTPGKNGLVRLSSGANAAGDMVTNGAQLHRALTFYAENGNLSFEARVLVSSLANAAYYIGFTDQVAALEMPFTIGASDAITSNASNAVGFCEDSASDADNIFFVGVKDDVDAVAQNSGVDFPAGASAFITYRVEISADGTAYFYINDVQVGRSMANAVNPAVALTPVIAIFSRSNTQKTMDVDYINAQQNR